MATSELIAVISGVLGLLGTIIAYGRKIYKQVSLFIEDQEEVRDSLKDIKQELTTNGGKSLKDMVIKMKITCDTINVRQRVLDQRSKAALHYQKEALFEVDRSANLVWCNDSFRKLMMEDSGSGELSGKDWISIIDESKRREFCEEVDSCVKMCRKIDIETVDTQGGALHFIGYPYKIGRNNHEGFLIHLKKEN